MFRVAAGAEILVEGELNKLADLVAAAIKDINLEWDQSGRYEEFPAYILRLGEVEYALVGRSGEEDTDPVCFSISGWVKKDLAEIFPYLAPSVRALLASKEIPADGFLDFSDELEKLLREQGVPAKAV
ncbi:hypothetical protein HNP46_004664 [Pseudomonas nitritireducens]|uniref:Uncharacterized protein n=1 Tax=Pseudomonas nitroreducens TaxID=46680 RepID=A0A7W7P2B7_PSENT|nr:hypothetical protein [Pseudomonas nitritireducens]MBB4865763.1 hypothetical protein [Pseudomonas nitritireducens]